MESEFYCLVIVWWPYNKWTLRDPNIKKNLNTECTVGVYTQRHCTIYNHREKCKNLFGNDLQYAVMSEYEVHTYLHREHLFSIILLITTTLLGGKLTIHREYKVSNLHKNNNNW